MTPEEIAALFDDEEYEVAAGDPLPATPAQVDGPPVAGSPEAIAAEFLTPEPPAPLATARPEPAPQGFLDRSMGRLQQGASDYMSTLAGDTFGRSGDVTQRDRLGPLERSVKALGGDAIPAVGDIGADALITAGKQVLPPSWQENIGDAFNYVAESRPAQYAGEKIEQLQTNFPRATAQASDLLNIASAIVPVKKPRLDRTLANIDNRAKDAAKARRSTEMERMLRPDDLKGVSPEVQPGINTKITAKPDDYFQGQIDEVVDSTRVNPRKSNAEANVAIQSQIDDVRVGLDERLAQAPDIEAPQITYAMDQARAKIDKTPSLTGNPGKVAEKIYDAFDDILKNEMVDGKIRPDKLLDARRKLDRYLKDNRPSIFSDGSDAYTIATKEIRDTLNSLVGAAAPDARTAESLAEMSNLLTARDTLFPRALAEIDTSRLGRYVTNLERRTGLAPPRSPLAATANVQSPAVGVLTAGLAGGVALKDAAKGLGGRIARQSQRGLTQTMKQGVPAAQRAALLSLTKEDEEEEN